MANPYELWNTRTSLGVTRDVKAETWHFGQFFGMEFRSDSEYIDFEKLPIRERLLATFTLPMGRGGSVYSDSQALTRFKPAYVKAEDTIDPTMPLTKRAGIDRSMIDIATITPMQRLNLIKAEMATQQTLAVMRTWEWLGARAIIDGQVTIAGPGYPTTTVQFGRDAGHTIVLGGGLRFGDAGVSIIDFIQTQCDRMNNAEFGGLPTKITMGQGVWNVLRKDAEFLAQQAREFNGATLMTERGLTSGGANGGKVFMVGYMNVGGAGGARIELWVNNETYKDRVTGAQTRYLGTNEMVFTADPSAINGYQCFGMIVDRAAEYQALPIFPANWLTGNNPQVEWIGHTSSPLMVPINPNATLKATVIA